jgi:hypothetical protein
MTRPALSQTEARKPPALVSSFADSGSGSRTRARAKRTPWEPNAIGWTTRCPDARTSINSAVIRIGGAAVIDCSRSLGVRAHVVPSTCEVRP